MLRCYQIIQKRRLIPKTSLFNHLIYLIYFVATALSSVTVATYRFLEKFVAPRILGI